MPLQGTISSCHFGTITESAENYLLAIAWSSFDALDSFKKSPARLMLLEVMKSYSSEAPVETIIDFGRMNWSMHLGPNTDVRIVYFPKTVSQETRAAIGEVQPLITNFYFPADSPYATWRARPVHGWLNGLQKWNGEEVVACLWCHFWTSKTQEEKFKKTVDRVYDDGHSQLRLEAFNEELSILGALGWEEFHVDFHNWVPVMWPPDWDEDDEDDEDAGHAEMHDEESEGQDDTVRRDLSEMSLS